MSFFYEIPQEFKQDIDKKGFFDYTIARILTIEAVLKGQSSAASAFSAEVSDTLNTLTVLSGSVSAPPFSLVDIFGAGTVNLESPVVGGLTRIRFNNPVSVILNGGEHDILYNGVSLRSHVLSLPGETIDVLYSVTHNKWRIV